MVYDWSAASCQSIRSHVRKFCLLTVILQWIRFCKPVARPGFQQRNLGMPAQDSHKIFTRCQLSPCTVLEPLFHCDWKKLPTCTFTEFRMASSRFGPLEKFRVLLSIPIIKQYMNVPSSLYHSRMYKWLSIQSGNLRNPVINKINIH